MATWTIGKGEKYTTIAEFEAGESLPELGGTILNRKATPGERCFVINHNKESGLPVVVLE